MQASWWGKRTIFPHYPEMREKMTKERRIMKFLYCLALVFVAWSMTWGRGLGRASHAGPHFHPRTPIQESLYRADKNVDEAWEAFHQAALGGTLASPAIQRQIEQALHESRLLLVDARKAARDNDERVVSLLTARIAEISTQIKENSRRQKP